MLEKIAFGLRDTEDNEKLLFKKIKNLVCILLWSGPQDLVTGIVPHRNPASISHYRFAFFSGR